MGLDPPRWRRRHRPLHPRRAWCAWPTVRRRRPEATRAVPDERSGGWACSVTPMPATTAAWARSPTPPASPSPAGAPRSPSEPGPDGPGPSAGSAFPRGAGLSVVLGGAGRGGTGCLSGGWGAGAGGRRPRGRPRLRPAPTPPAVRRCPRGVRSWRCAWRSRSRSGGLRGGPPPQVHRDRHQHRPKPTVLPRLDVGRSHLPRGSAAIGPRP